VRLGAPYSERDLHGPAEISSSIARGRGVTIKDGRADGMVLALIPFDVVGWDGMVYRSPFNSDDFEPITWHSPPAAASASDVRGHRVRHLHVRAALLDTHPRRQVPYAHPNVGADEVLYYVRGRFGSRRGVEGASFTAPPQASSWTASGTIVASRPVTRTDELAVMVDTMKPLYLTGSDGDGRSESIRIAGWGELGHGSTSCDGG